MPRFHLKRVSLFPFLSIRDFVDDATRTRGDETRRDEVEVEATEKVETTNTMTFTTATGNWLYLVSTTYSQESRAYLST